MQGDVRPVGFPIPQWRPRPYPPATTMVGRYCRLERLSAERHAAELFAACAGAPENWIYLHQDPPADFAEYENWVAASAQRDDPFYYAIIAGDRRRALGVAALMRIDPANGVIEVGSIHYAPALQR
ncbi:MAG: GNAT family N-acetyltransferase, partial [Acetobacteraceae bacterium]